MIKRVLLFVVLGVFSLASLDAQVMWNVKGGLMPWSIYDGSSYEKETSLEWMAGLEIEVPLSSKFNIETGLRFRKHETYNDYEYYRNRDFWGVKSGKIELQLRFAYKQPLGRRFSMHIGVGPYASYATLEGSSNFGKSLHAGMESSIAFNWKCLSLGATYNLPIYKGYEDMNKPALMATLGLRFKSGAWKYVGIGALAVATVGAGVALAAGAMKGDESGNYSSSDYGSSSSSSSSDYSSSSSSSKSSTEHTASEVSAKNRDANTYSNYESQLIKMNTYWETQYNDSHRRDIQQKMRNIRTKWESRGFQMFRSEWESWDGRKR